MQRARMAAFVYYYDRHNVENRGSKCLRFDAFENQEAINQMARPEYSLNLMRFNDCGERLCMSMSVSASVCVSVLHIPSECGSRDTPCNKPAINNKFIPFRSTVLITPTE